MAFRIDPRGDLPISIVQSKSLYAGPNSTFSQYEHSASITSNHQQASFPKKKPCYDWIFSSASNVHIAVDRSSFRQYVSFKSYVLAVADRRPIPVRGIGTVELKIRCQPGSREHHKVVLENVLHIPSWVCNIVSDACFSPAKDYDHEWSEFGIRF